MSTDFEEDDDDEEGGVLDTNRYDVAPQKLAMYKNSALKRKLKSKFVTGQNSDQIVQNLLNMSDSENEQDIEKKRDDKEQLRKIEANDTKVDKKDKRKKRMEANNEKPGDSDSGSEIESEKEEGGEEGAKKEEEKGHAPL